MAMNDNFLKRLFFAERVPFSEKRDVNWAAVKWTLAIVMVCFVGVVLVLPAEQAEPSEEVLAGSNQKEPSPEPPPVMSTSSRDLTQYYAAPRSINPPSRQGPMIVSRGGLDYRSQLPPGSRIRVRLLQGAIVSTESMPIIAQVVEDVSTENGLAIEKGAKVFGEASFDDSGDVATVAWTSIQFVDGREKQLAAIGVSLSGHVGVQGKVHSKRAQNIAGHTIARFVGAYAEGSVKRGVLGFSQGGAENGLKTAVAETAKDQADSYASDLKREKRWIELLTGAESLVVLKQPFAFRDPGTYGN